jgi:hypothetical protein
MSKKIILGVCAAASIGALVYFVSGGLASNRSELQTQSATPASVGLPQFIETKAEPAKIQTQAIRKQYIESSDLKALHDRLLASHEPGNLFYANLAKAECLNFSGHFGQGATAWEKFNQQVSDAAPDRAQRVNAFHYEVGRCKGFEASTGPALLSALKTTFNPNSDDPLARLSFRLLQAGKKPQSVSDAELATMTATVLAIMDPELLESLGRAIFGRSQSGANREAGPDDEIANRFAWGAAIEKVMGNAPVSYRSMQAATCIIGKGCDARTALATAERSMWDLPPQRSSAILARATALSPSIEAAISSRSVDAVLALGKERR